MIYRYLFLVMPFVHLLAFIASFPISLRKSKSCCKKRLPRLKCSLKRGVMEAIPPINANPTPLSPRISPPLLGKQCNLLLYFFPIFFFACISSLLRQVKGLWSVCGSTYWQFRMCQQQVPRPLAAASTAAAADDESASNGFLICLFA